MKPTESGYYLVIPKDGITIDGEGEEIVYFFDDTLDVVKLGCAEIYPVADFDFIKEIYVTDLLCGA